MGEIDDLEHAEDQRQANRNKGVDQAEDDAVDGKLDEINRIDFHGTVSIRNAQC